jgi:DsbC/DsbD-like thiol-disulfide interchange protein
MNATGMKLRAMLGLLFAGLMTAFPAPAAADDNAASQWLDLPHSRVRLIAAAGLPHRGTPVLAAGVELTLDKGWKTYWRTPGDGMPPLVDWSQSQGIAKAELLWPVPRRFEEPDGMLSFGYKDRVVLPIVIVPADPHKTISFKVRLTYGVCAEVCIPVDAELTLEIPPNLDSSYRNILIAALEFVPRRQARGVYCPHSFITAKRRMVNSRPTLLIKTATEETATGLDLFVEAPDGVDLPPPRRQPRASRGRLFHIISFGTARAADALIGKTLTLTMVANQGSCETTWRVE